MQKWIDLLAPSAAAVAILIAIALAIQAIAQGRAIKRLEERIADQDGAAARVSLDRIRALQRRTSAGGGGGGAGVRLGPLAAVIAIAAVLAGTGWYVFLRGDSTEGAKTPTTTGTTGQTKTLPNAQEVRTTANPNPTPLTPSRGAFTILVQNGTFVPGAAAAGVVPALTQAGYNTAQPTNATRQDFKVSEVVYLPGKENVADNVAKDLGISKLSPLDGIEINQSTSDIDAVVIVGEDLANKYRP